MSTQPNNAAETAQVLAGRLEKLGVEYAIGVYRPSDFHQPSGGSASPRSSWEPEAQPEGSVRGIESKGDRIRRSCRFAAAPGRNLLWCRSGVIRKPLIIAVRHQQNLAGPTAIV
jgi:hypothetical protein